MFVAIILLVLAWILMLVLPGILARSYSDERSRVVLISGGVFLVLGGMLCAAVDNGWVLQITESEEAAMFLKIVGGVPIMLGGVFDLFEGIYEKLGELKLGVSAELKEEEHKKTSSSAYVDGWECGACHAVNPRWTSSCLKCAKPRTAESKMTAEVVGECVKVDRSGASLTCPKCGTSQRPDKKYCFHCGVRFE